MADFALIEKNRRRLVDCVTTTVQVVSFALEVIFVQLLQEVRDPLDRFLALVISVSGDGDRDGHQYERCGHRQCSWAGDRPHQPWRPSRWQYPRRRPCRQRGHERGLGYDAGGVAERAIYPARNDLRRHGLHEYLADLCGDPRWHDYSVEHLTGGGVQLRRRRLRGLSDELRQLLSERTGGHGRSDPRGNSGVRCALLRVSRNPMREEVEVNEASSGRFHVADRATSCPRRSATSSRRSIVQRLASGQRLPLARVEAIVHDPLGNLHYDSQGAGSWDFAPRVSCRLCDSF